MNSDWLSFWDTPHSIYVNPRHKDAHYRLIAQEIAALVPAADARVLDYGCGEALHADLVAAACGELLLSDGAPGVHARVAARFAGEPKIRALSPDEVGCLRDGGLDLIVLHSVAQYLTAEQTLALLVLFHRLLHSGGVLWVSDVIPPGTSPATDAAALLKFAAQNGFLFAALTGLSRTLFSDYRRLRARVGLTQYAEAAMIDRLNTAGFTAQRTGKNIGHNQARMAFMARRRG